MIPASPLELLDRITPIQCRAIARRMDSRGSPIPLGEIAARSGLPLRRVSWISRQRTWATIPVGEAAIFMQACGVTLRNQRLHIRYIRRTAKAEWPMAHLAKLNWKERQTIHKSLT